MIVREKGKRDKKKPKLTLTLKSYYKLAIDHPKSKIKLPFNLMNEIFI